MEKGRQFWDHSQSSKEKDRMSVFHTLLYSNPCSHLALIVLHSLPRSQQLTADLSTVCISRFSFCPLCLVPILPLITCTHSPSPPQLFPSSMQARIRVCDLDECVAAITLIITCRIWTLMRREFSCMFKSCVFFFRIPFVTPVGCQWIPSLDRSPLPVNACLLLCTRCLAVKPIVVCKKSAANMKRFSHKTYSLCDFEAASVGSNSLKPVVHMGTLKR